MLSLVEKRQARQNLTNLLESYFRGKYPLPMARNLAHRMARDRVVPGEVAQTLKDHFNYAMEKRSTAQVGE